MSKPMGRSSRLPLAWAVAAFMATGCWGARRVSEDLAPPDLGPAKAALVASLEAWKSGRRDSGIVTGSGPAVGIVDATRIERPLLEYEVVGPLAVVGKGRPFAVRLVMDTPRDTVTTRYVVLGRDPIWVFRQEDYERMVHWEHKMDGESEVDPAQSAGR